MSSQAMEIQPSPLSSRWIQDFEREILRRKHILLYGNVHDQFLRFGVYQTVDEFLTTYFRDKGFDIFAKYDPVDGINVVSDDEPRADGGAGEPLPADARRRYQEVIRRGVLQRNPSMSDPTRPDAIPAPSTPPNPKDLPRTVIPGGGPQAMNRRITPEEAFSELRIILGQNVATSAVLVDLGDMLTSMASQYSEAERRALALLKKCTLEASLISQGTLAGHRNTLVVLASDLKRVPDWFYLDNPYVSLVQVARPNKLERRQFALDFIRPSGRRRGFFGGENVSLQRPSVNQPSDLEQLADEFADLTEGFQAIDLGALGITSWTAQLPVAPKRMHRLIDFFKFGLKEDPWEDLNLGKVQHARESLSKSVIGQPKAVDAVVTMLTSARVGLNLTGAGQTGAPKGVFFFVGPTGVGKTELAKSLTKLVFGDERAFARFDMSEYKEEHAAEKLAGSPPGFVGYEEGGQLTNRVLQQPHSILLFDEIEKAHPRVLDKFLQILEDGRLTDGKGQTAYFNQAAIIFTSNIGASDLTHPESSQIIREGIMRRVQAEGTDKFPYDHVAKYFQEEVRWYFTSRIGRAELLNRLGDSIVAFDLLRPEFVSAICSKFLALLASSAQEKYKVTLRYLPSCEAFIVAQMAEADNMLLGGRRIKTLISTNVRDRLNEWIFSTVPDVSQLTGRAIEVGLSPAGVLEARLV